MSDNRTRNGSDGNYNFAPFSGLFAFAGAYMLMLAAALAA